MSSTHTPGPWTHDPETERIYAEGGGRWIASVGEVGTDTDGESAANGALIAAAPDLLEALRDMRGLAAKLEEQLLDLGAVDEEDQQRFDVRHEAARAAIAKIEEAA